MLRVYYSNRTEELLDALVERIESTRRSVFEPVRLVVPNRNMDVYVRLGIARLAGVCANVETLTLRQFLDETSGRPEAEARLFDGVLSALFDADLLAEPELAPVAAYLGAAGAAADGPGVDRRRVQLALEIRRLFRIYEISRPEILESWRAGLHFDDPARREAEAWQRRIWNHVRPVFGDGGALSPAAEPTDVALPTHLFGTPYVARKDAEALARLARDRDLFLYTFNPCQEIWEAFKEPLPTTPAPTTRRYERRGSTLGPGEVFSVENPFRLSNPGELLPLRLWGRPARESLRLVNAVSGCELVPKVVAPRGASLLHTLQRDIVLRRADRSTVSRPADFEGDESIVFLRCTSARRELEAVAAEIWSLVANDEDRPKDREPLRFHEIAVLLVPAESERYQSLIGSVFAEMHDIPHNIVDLPIRGESRLAEAASMLLALPLGRFGREEVLRFVTHPVVMRSFPDADPSQWVRACERLGIYRGVDRRDRKGSYVEKDLFNWEQGLSRLALGVFAPADSTFRRDGDSYIAEEVSLDESHGLGRLALLVRSLLADAREASRVQMTLPAWADFLGALLSTYLKPRNEADQNVLDRCLGTLASLASTPLGSRKVRYAVAHELVAHELEALSGSRGAYLTDGVVVSSFLPMRSIPFKVIFVVGLAENAFPARDREAYLDLSRAARRAGDVSPREEDKYLFLETLLCARDRFYVSYVSRDERTGDALSPSSLVLELEETLLKSYVTADNLAVRTQPFHRYDDPETVRCSPSALAEKNASRMGRELREHLGARRLPKHEELPDELRSLLRGVDLPAALAAKAESRARGRPLTLGALRRFLECPLQGSARFSLMLDEVEDEDRLWRGEEPLASTPLTRAMLLRETLQRGGTDALYHELRETYELRGLVPTGALGCAEAREHLDILRLYREGLRELGSESGATVRISPPALPLVLDKGSRRYEIVAPPELELVLDGVAAPVPVRFVSQGASRFHPRRESLRGFLRHVFSAAANEGGGGNAEGGTDFLVLNARRGALDVERFRFAPVCRDEARSYLAGLAAELAAGIHAYLLPCELVFEVRDGGEGKGELDPAKTSSRFGPVTDLAPYAPPSGSYLEELIERRFGLYFRLCATAERSVA